MKEKVLGLYTKAKADITKLDTLMQKYQVYQIVLVLVFILLFIFFGNSFTSNKIVRNYIVNESSSDASQLIFGPNSTYQMHFETKNNNLDMMRIMIDRDRTILSSSDTALVTITNLDDEIVLEERISIYTSKNYISVSLSDVNLEANTKYKFNIVFDSIAYDSKIVVFAHQESSFANGVSIDNGDTVAYEEGDEFTLTDYALGFSKTINITYIYKTTDVNALILHITILSILALCCFVRLDRTKKSSTYIIEVYRGVMFSLLIYLLAEVLNIENNSPLNFFKPYSIKHYFCLITSLLIIFLVYYLFHMISSRYWAAMLITATLFGAIAYTNHMKLVMRGDSFMPWDLMSAGIAVATGSTYYFHITINFIMSILILVAVLCLIRITYVKPRHTNKERVVRSLLGLSLITLLMSSIVLNTKLLDRLKVYYEVYPPIQSFNENGTYLAFLMHLNNINARGNEDNSTETYLQLIDQYELNVYREDLNDNIMNNSSRPNVICIMSEAYSDLDSIREFETSEEVTPFFDELVARDETISGDMAVSIFGGGTCNTEFEFLTGYSMSALLPGSSVYSLYVNSVAESAMPLLFEQAGYRTVALHSFDGDWWERRAKYPMLGFEEFITRDEFGEDSEYVRRYLSDYETFDRIIEEYENSSEPLFLFCVTMQNHADFASHYDNMNYNIEITDMVREDGSHYTYAENYLSLLRESDRALEHLITYLENSDEPTIVVFFGDHFPTLSDGFYDAILETDMGNVTIEESLPIYETPYFLWTNYDVEELASNGADFEFGNTSITSPNFLGQMVLDLAGIESPSSRSVLRVLHNEISAISSVAIYDNFGNPHVNTDTLNEDVLQMIEDYYVVQYGLIYYNDMSEQDAIYFEEVNSNVSNNEDIT